MLEIVGDGLEKYFYRVILGENLLRGTGKCISPFLSGNTTIKQKEGKIWTANTKCRWGLASSSA